VVTPDFSALEESVIADMRKYYTETVIDHFLNPRNVGEIQNADGFGRVTGPCGDTMEIWLKIKNGTVAEANFLTDGCGTTIVSGSIVTELVKGKTIPQALKINQEDVLDALGGLPEDSVHCALLAANTLREALKNCLDFKKEPWKRAYQRH